MSERIDAVDEAVYRANDRGEQPIALDAEARAIVESANGGRPFADVEREQDAIAASERATIVSAIVDLAIARNAEAEIASLDAIIVRLRETIDRALVGIDNDDDEADISRARDALDAIAVAKADRDAVRYENEYAISRAVERALDAGVVSTSLDALADGRLVGTDLVAALVDLERALVARL